MTLHGENHVGRSLQRGAAGAEIERQQLAVATGGKKLVDLISLTPCSLTPYPLSEGEGSRMLCGCSLTPMPLSKGEGSRMLCGCSLTPYPLSEGERSRMHCGCSLTPMPLSKGEGSRIFLSLSSISLIFIVFAFVIVFFLLFILHITPLSLGEGLGVRFLIVYPSYHSPLPRRGG